MLKKIFILLIITVSLLIITGDVAYSLISREIQYETTLVISPLPPEVIQRSPEAAQKLEEKINTFTQTINEASKAGVKKEVSMQITQGEVNSLIEKRIKEGILKLPIKIKDLNVQFRDGWAQVNIKGVLMGVTINALITVEVNLTDGKPKIIVKDVNLGRLPLPGAVKKKLNDIISEQSKKIEMTDLPFEFKDIVIKNGQIFIRGITKPITKPPPTHKTVELRIRSTVYKVDGITQTMDAAPFIEGGRTMVPVRFLAEGLGGTVGWDNATRTVTVRFTKPILEIKLIVGNPSATVNGKKVQIDINNLKVMPAIKNNRTFVPLRFLVEQITGSTMNWIPPDIVIMRLPR